MSANMPWKPPRLSLVREIFEGDEKLARRSVWAAMLAGRTAPSGEEESARSFRGVQSVVPGAWAGGVEKDGGENLWEQSPRVAFSHGNGRIILHSRKIIP